jgi:tRNA-uridine 2-sulfurtransferase
MSSKPPIVAALSGGVDSAVAAAMLVARGERVVGVTMRLYDARGTSAAAGRCCGPRDIEDARRVCQHLDIPFYVVDLEQEFRRDVIDDFVDAYLAGETPNPCVRCNQHIKFTPLLKRARALGAERVATGHYARLEPDGVGGRRLRRGVDAGKDQSYFLFSMPPDELAAVEFPLGGLRKEEVRDRARAFGLPNADKKDSQEICFVPDGDYAGFVARAALTRGREVPPAGDIVDQAGAVVGRHRGVHHYTVGQRRGLGDVARPEPVYVVGVEPGADRVVVGPRAAAARRTIRVREVRWLAPPPDGAPLQVSVQVRHRARPVAAEVRDAGQYVEVSFVDEAVVAAPGQAAVFYDGDAVVGGGWIERDPTGEALTGTSPTA